jgi:MFS family permease
MSDITSTGSDPGRRRWLVLGVIALAQLMVVLDLTVMNIALPSAQRALHFTTVDRQWVVTSYTAANLASARVIGRQALTGLALVHGYDTAFWWTAGIFAGGAVIGGTLLRRGPLVPPGAPSQSRSAAPTAEAKARPAPSA